MNNILNVFIQGATCFAKGACYLANRLTECCRAKSKPRAKDLVERDFTTELKNQKKLIERKVQTIYLIGENHYVGDEAVKFKRNIFLLAAAQKLLYAMEGLERDDFAEKQLRDTIERRGVVGMGKGYLYGVEDPFFQLFNNALDLNFFLRSTDNSAQLEALIDSKKNDLLCSLVLQTNQNYLTEIWSQGPENNSIFKCLLMNKSSLIEESFQIQSNFFSKKIQVWEHGEWFSFTQYIASSLGQDLKLKLPTEKIETLESLLKSLKEFKLSRGYEYSQQELENFNFTLNIILRNPFIAKNLKNLYSISEQANKPLVAILGNEHIPGITQILTNKGYTVKGSRELLEQLD